MIKRHHQHRRRCCAVIVFVFGWLLIGECEFFGVVRMMQASLREIFKKIEVKFTKNSIFIYFLKNSSKPANFNLIFLPFKFPLKLQKIKDFNNKNANIFVLKFMYIHIHVEWNTFFSKTIFIQVMIYFTLIIKSSYSSFSFSSFYFLSCHFPSYFTCQRWRKKNLFVVIKLPPSWAHTSMI